MVSVKISEYEHSSWDFNFLCVHADDIIKMSKKKNPGGKKPARQPVSILIIDCTPCHLVWKSVNNLIFYHCRSRNVHSRMTTLIKGMQRFSDLWKLDHP